MEALKGVREQKRELQAEKNFINDKITSLDVERQALLKLLPPGKDQQVPAKIKQAIEDMQRRYETTTLKN